jgi:Tol biopolymer transport system component
MAVSFPSFLPPNGEEIVFRGVVATADGPRSGLFAISVDGGEPRPLTATDGDHDGGYQVPVPSPDGAHLLYQVWDPVAEMETLYLLDLGTGTDEALPRTGAQYGEGSAAFSPDGSIVAFRGFEEPGYQLYVMPIDGSEKPRALTGITPGEAWHEFSPDGTKVMLNRSEAQPCSSTWRRERQTRSPTRSRIREPGSGSRHELRRPLPTRCPRGLRSSDRGPLGTRPIVPMGSPWGVRRYPHA